jgi:hypothetical protein
MKNIASRERTSGNFFGKVVRALAPIAIVFFAAGLALGGQEQSSNPARGKWMAGLTLGGGFPSGAFSANIGHPGGGLDFYFGTRLGDSSFIVGFDISYVLYGIESRDEYLSGTIPVQVEVETTNNILQGLAFLRFQPFGGRVRPYIEALGGLSYLFTDTSIYDNEGLDYDEIASDINFDDATLAVGAGVGMEIRLGKDRGDRISVKRPEYFLDLKVRYLSGGTAQYLREGAIIQDGDKVTYLYNESKTNLISVQVGVSISF